MSGYTIWGIVLAILIGATIFLRIRYPAGSRGRRNMKWGIRALVALIVAAFLHYTLPQHDIVRITGTDNRLTTVGWENSIFYASPDTGTAESATNRYVRLIYAAFPNGKVMVYRNEDTGWVWPPYFKYDSSNLQAEASNLESKAEPYQWVSVTHYGWRAAWLSIYPNAVKIRAVAGPDVSIVPWINIVILTLLAIGALMLRRMWLQFREREIDPVLDDVGGRIGDIDARADAARAGLRGFWGRTMARLWFWTRTPRS